MEIVKGIEIIDLCLYLKKEKILILSDTHIGYEESLNKQGVLIPRFQFRDIIERLEKVLKKTGKLDKIIINGDIKHEFGTISEQEWRHTLMLLDFLKKHCNEVILVKGNHDTILGPIADKRRIRVVDCVVVCDGSLELIENLKSTENKLSKGFRLSSRLASGNLSEVNLTSLNKPFGIKSISNKSIKKAPLKNKKIIKNKKNNILIIHGDKLDENILKLIKKNNIKKIIIGHEHPAVSIVEEPRVELFKCFLKGKYKGKTLIVQPSFNLVTEGTDVMKEELLSPFLQYDLSDFKVYVVGDKVYEFGKLKKFTRLELRN